MHARGVLFAVSAPSGAGKSTLCRQLMAKKQMNLHLSISATTRAPRPSEENGKHYYFLSEDEFLQRKQQGEFLEWAQIHGHFYGTLKSEVENKLQQGINILFDIDWQGVEQIKQNLPDDLVSVFILPPSITELKKRLQNRAEDSEAVIMERLSNAKLEIEKSSLYDYVLVNDQLEVAFERLYAILLAEQQKRSRLINFDMLLKQLLKDLTL